MNGWVVLAIAWMAFTVGFALGAAWCAFWRVEKRLTGEWEEDKKP